MKLNVFAIFCIMFLGLNSCSNYAEKKVVKVQEELFYDLINLQSRQLEYSKDLLSSYQMNIWEGLNSDDDGFLHWYTPMINEMSSIIERYEELIEYNSSKGLGINGSSRLSDELRRELIAEKTTFIKSFCEESKASFQKMLYGNSDVVRIGEKQKKRILEEYERKLLRFNPSDVFTNDENLSLEDFKLQWALLDQVFIENQSVLVNELEEFIYGSVAEFIHTIAPYVITKTPVVSKNNIFEAKIALIDFASMYDYKNTIIVVNGDTIPVDSFGYGVYRVEAVNEGIQKLDISGAVKIRMTNNMITCKGEYSYLVE